MNDHEAAVRRYFGMWREKDGTMLGDVLADDVAYAESHGPEYRGLDQVRRWFREWNERGTVLTWDIGEFLHQGPATAVTWTFRCEYDGVVSGFDGVSVLRFDGDGRISEVREFASKSERHFPFGDPSTDRPRSGHPAAP